MINKLKNFFIFLSIVCISNYSIAQPDFKDSTEIYTYWCQRGIIEVVHSYMQDYNASNKLTNSEKKGIDAYSEKFINDIDKKKSSNIHNDFNELVDFLSNNNWETTSKKIATPLIDRFQKNVIIGNNFFSIDNIDGVQYSEKSSEIINNYVNSINSIRPKAKSAEEQEKPIEQQPVEKSGINSTKTAKMLFVLLFFSMSFLMGYFCHFLILKRKILKILGLKKKNSTDNLKEEKAIVNFFKYLSLTQVLKTQKEDFEKIQKEKDLEIRRLREDFLKLKNESKILLEENIELGKKNEDLNDKIQVYQNENSGSINEKLNILKTLFFNIPGINGTFKIENGKEHKGEDSFYKIEVINNSNGNIYYLSGSYDLRAIENIDYYLNPVCEVQNISYRAIARKVETVKHGTVILKGDSWQINEKVKIKLV